MEIRDLKSEEWYFYTQKIRLGDIGAVIEPGLVSRLAERMILPTTPYLHHFLIGDYIPDDNDFVILESIPSHGVAVGRLSWHLSKTVAVFRPNAEMAESLNIFMTPEQMGRKAALQATKFGRSKYDFRVCLDIGWRAFAGCLRNWAQGRGFCVHYTAFPPSRDKRVICTEVVDEGYRDIFPIFDRNYAVLPSNLMSQYHDGYLDIVCTWHKTT
jgi:hypothetical protein